VAAERYRQVATFPKSHRHLHGSRREQPGAPEPSFRAASVRRASARLGAVTDNRLAGGRLSSAVRSDTTRHRPRPSYGAVLRVAAASPTANARTPSHRPGSRACGLQQSPTAISRSASEECLPPFPALSNEMHLEATCLLGPRRVSGGSKAAGRRSTMFASTV
jgi:hypothetical protein